MPIHRLFAVAAMLLTLLAGCSGALYSSLDPYGGRIYPQQIRIAFTKPESRFLEPMLRCSVNQAYAPFRQDGHPLIFDLWVRDFYEADEAGMAILGTRSGIHIAYRLRRPGDNVILVENELMVLDRGMPLYTDEEWRPVTVRLVEDFGSRLVWLTNGGDIEGAMPRIAAACPKDDPRGVQ